MGGGGTREAVGSEVNVGILLCWGVIPGVHMVCVWGSHSLWGCMHGGCHMAWGEHMVGG